MANIIGIDYYRAVSETSKGEWSQVYVKTAFDEEELARVGCVFGVLKLSGEDLVERGMKLIDKVEKYCGNEGNKGNLAGLLSLLKEEEADGAFVWVSAEKEGVRRIKAGALPGNSIAIRRGGQRVFLSERGDGKVIMGEVREGDILYFGTKKAVDLIDAEITEKKEDIEALTEKVTTEMMSKDEGARAALVLMVKEAAETEASTAAAVTNTPEDRTYKREVMERLAKRQEEELAGDRLVGVSGLSGKIAEAKLSWKDFATRWSSASKLPSEEGLNKRKKMFLLLGTVFLVVLLASVFAGYLKIKKDALVNRYNSVFEPLEKKRVEAENLYSLNPVGARDLLRSVKDETAAKKGEFAETEFVDEIAAFEKKVEESWSKVSGEQKASLTLFFDMGLVRSEMKGDRLAFNGKDFLILDQQAGLVAKVSYPEKRQEVILGKGEGANWLDVAGLGANNTLLRKTGLTAILSGTKTELEFDSAVLSPTAIDAFTGAVYVLDKGASEIWRFAESGGVIGERRRWLATEVEADLTGGVDIAIDTDIWVGTENGKVLRFRRGQPERFGLNDVPADFRIKRLAVNADSPYLAVLDSDKGRVVLFNKDNGAFVKQLLADEFKNAMDLVWLSEKELMVVSGNKLYLTSI